jgi:hypothetical protein
VIITQLASLPVCRSWTVNQSSALNNILRALRYACELLLVWWSLSADWKTLIVQISYTLTILWKPLPTFVVCAFEFDLVLDVWISGWCLTESMVTYPLLKELKHCIVLSPSLLATFHWIRVFSLEHTRAIFWDHLSSLIWWTLESCTVIRKRPLLVKA